MCALYNFAPNEWSNGGNTAILRLAAGDTLSVGAARGYDNNVYGGSDQVYTTFNGALIAKDSDLNDKGI